MMDFSKVKNIRIPEGDVKNIIYNGEILWRCGWSLGELEPGSIVNLMEDKMVPYIVIAHDHHGKNLTTLLRKDTDGTSTFMGSAPTAAWNNKYSSSRLKTAMDNLYAALPEETKALIETVEVPVREHANTGENGITVPSHFFPLSRIELLNVGTELDGKYIGYFSSNDLRAATDGTTKRAYWTRSVVSGMDSRAWAITTSGIEENVTETVSRYLRPACCIASNVFVTETDGEFFITSDE